MNSYFINILKGINLALTECEFPDKLKKSQVVPLYERQDPLRKESYCPVSLLRHASKFYERIFSAHNRYFITTCIKSLISVSSLRIS